MDRAFAATIVAAVALLAGGLAAGAYLTDAGLFDDRLAVEPGVTQFEAGNATCGPRSSRVAVGRSAARQGSFLTVRGNVTVPPTADGLTPTFERVGLANYTLTLAPTDTGDGRTSCGEGEGVRIGYTVSVQIPNGENEPFRVVVRHGSERVRVFDYDPVRGTETTGNASGTPAPTYSFSRTVPPERPSHSMR